MKSYLVVTEESFVDQYGYLDYYLSDQGEFDSYEDAEFWQKQFCPNGWVEEDTND